MDDILLKKIEQKIQDTISNKDDIKQLIHSLSSIDDSKSFVLGIIVGRIYNAFYYHTKRMFNREPTSDEFQEFLEFIKKRKPDFENLR
ncbi:MAG: hypothetical protein HOK63_04655 [Thaumarchaeota archaeon]|jgi:hypothetical protein|nr:hypothetical protein [Nitrososphaerota archaeon]MBT5842295.1 hypothetical protein [Nitrososphaerota archaeon]MBT6468923.1 hypothetical protein [Nitrososphaerota archaeon]